MKSWFETIMAQRRILRMLALGGLLVAAAAGPVHAQRPQNGAGESRAPGASALSLLPADATTEHTLDTGSEKLAYAATAGTMSLYDQAGERSAAIFYTAYTLKAAPAEARPVTFVFNGGPGAASVYLHLGLVGPQVADFGPDHDGAAARLRDNPESWLKFTDLVLIDPVGAGWSRAAKPDKSGDFWSIQSDAQTLAKVIALYVAKNNRAASPKYILGESYGGFRSVKVARALQQQQGIVVSGIVMLSPFLEGSLHSGTRFPLAAALQLPSLAAAELDRSSRFTAEALAAAEDFALGDYLVTLARRPSAGEAARVFYERIAAMTGLPVEIVARTRGFIGGAYVKNSREARSEVVSPYDAAFAAPDAYPESASAEGDDPMLDGFLQSLGGLFVGYARERLGFKTDLTFNLLNREVSGKWDWGGRGGRSQASATNDLRELLALNPRLRILVAHGRSDVVTPYMFSRYVLDHLPPIGGPGRTALKIYKGGHMFYIDRGARAAFTSDAHAFYRATGL